MRTSALKSGAIKFLSRVNQQKFSVVIITYNRGKLLKLNFDNIKQFLNLPREEVEYIIIDDGSQREQKEILYQWLEQGAIDKLYVAKSRQPDFARACQNEIISWFIPNAEYIIHFKDDIIPFRSPGYKKNWVYEAIRYLETQTNAIGFTGGAGNWKRNFKKLSGTTYLIGNMLSFRHFIIKKSELMHILAGMGLANRWIYYEVHRMEEDFNRYIALYKRSVLMMDENKDFSIHHWENYDEKKVDKAIRMARDRKNWKRIVNLAPGAENGFFV